MIFQNSLVKSLIHKIKQHKNFFKNNKKNTKTNSKPQNLKKNYFTYQYFFKKNFQNFVEIAGKISNPSNTTQQKFHNF